MKQLKLWLTVHTSHSLVLLVLAAAILPFLVLGQAQAISKTWDGGCGADTTWSCANNWSDNIVPGAGDTVTFDATSINNSVVDAGFAGTITTININSGYTGTISLNRSLTVSAGFSQAAGTFTANTQALSLDTFTLSGGSFTASSGTTSIGDYITISGAPTFNANGGTVELVGSTDSTYACDNVTFNLVKFLRDGGLTTVSSDCNLPLGNNPSANSAGEILVNGTLSGSGTLTVGAALILGNTGALSGFSGLSASILSIDGTYNFGSYNTFTIDGAFVLQTGASVVMPAGTASVGTDFTVNSGSTFNANGGTVNFDSDTDGTISCAGITFHLVTFTNTAGTKTVGNDCNIPLGNNPTVGTGSGTGGQGTQNNMNGTAATGYGSGGGGAGWYGGMGGNGLYGGGGGGAAGFTAPDRIGGTGGSGMVVFSPSGGTDVVRTSGNSYTVPAGVTSLKIWAIGAGGGGAGSPDIDTSSGGAGGAGGVAYETFTVVPGQIITYSLGDGGVGGINASNGNDGSDTTVTVGATTITGGGGAGGEFDTGNAAAGGSFLGGDGGAAGGSGSGASGDTGGGGGGGIGGADGIDNGGSGGTGGQANDVSGLFSVLSGLGYPTVGPGVGGTDANGGTGPFLALDGTLSGSGTLTSATNLILDSGGSLAGFSGLATTSSLDIKGSYNFGSYTSFTASVFTLEAGATFIAPSGTAYFSSFFTNNGGTFNPNGGTVVFNGTNQTITGDTTFYNLTKTVSSADTLIFASGSTQTILGKLTLQGGNPGRLLRLVGSPWSINALGTTSVAYVDVSNSDASGGKRIVACGSVDSGGNSNWSFSPSSCTPPPTPVPPAPAPTPSSGGGLSATSNIFNFALFQAALTNQNAQSQSPTFSSDGSLPSKIYDFVRQFPHRRELMKAAGQFLWALLILLILILLIGLWRLWLYFRRQKQAADDDGGPTTMTPPAWPPIGNSAPGAPLAGTTIHPTALLQEPAPPLAPASPLASDQITGSRPNEII